MSQCFAPTKIVITFETEGQGKFTPEEITQIAVCDPASGEVVQLRLPTKSVIIANHQVRLFQRIQYFTYCSTIRCTLIGGTYGGKKYNHPCQSVTHSK